MGWTPFKIIIPFLQNTVNEYDLKFTICSDTQETSVTSDNKVTKSTTDC